jgi:hypothetical protein
MSERLPVQVFFAGEPFDRKAVIHTLRHLAMRAGWILRPKADRRLIYASTDRPDEVDAGENDLVILSSEAVRSHMTKGRDPVPFDKNHPDRLPFCHPARAAVRRKGWIDGDVVAGAHALVNLMYERRNRPSSQDGWILFRDDWWTKAGIRQPEPLADLWLNCIAAESEKLGWPAFRKPALGQGNPQPCTLVLTHDVDYLPESGNRGFPRFIRALLRQLFVRKSPGDMRRIIEKYRNVPAQGTPYDTLRAIAAGETEAGANSSFQFILRRRHANDPAYDLRKQKARADDLRVLTREGFEICLHGSYRAGRTAGQLAEEKKEMEEITKTRIYGHRQHYLNFHPATFFAEVEKAGFCYDLSVGYNDQSGPRAGTLFPYRPYDVENDGPHSFWEIPFVLMDTTLATTCLFSSEEAFAHCREQIDRIEQAGGCVSIIWHQEQLGGLLDPGFDEIYWRLLEEFRKRGIRMTSGEKLLPELDGLWNRTIED